MKSATLNKADREVVDQLGVVLMALDARNDVNANQPGTFGHVWHAIATFVLNQTGIDIRNSDWNLGGWTLVSDGIQHAIYEAARYDSTKAAEGKDVEIVQDRRNDNLSRFTHVGFGKVERVTEHRIYVRQADGVLTTHKRYENGEQLGRGPTGWFQPVYLLVA